MASIPSHEQAGVQRVYHFINLAHGLSNLSHRRLKIAELMKLNDPFEFFGANLSEPNLRRAFSKMKEAMAKNRGIICFSRSWRNPVQWSHYADKHHGLCLGFDIPSKNLAAVNYSPTRFRVDVTKLANIQSIDLETAKALLFTKYSHWRYEQEMRTFTTLEKIDTGSGLYFADFSESLQLREVIVGALSDVTEHQILDALGELQNTVDVWKARLAFGSFRVVRQQNKKLWWPKSSM
jgi:Protein of unknown function (DUF2971)